MIYSIVVGLIAGWLAGQVMKGGGYGVLMDIILGLLWRRDRRINLRAHWASGPAATWSGLDHRVFRGRCGARRHQPAC